MPELLALVDGSTYSESVCDHAAWIAGRMGASVTVAHILGHRQGMKSDLSGSIGLGARSSLLKELSDLDAATARLAQKRGRAILEDAKARLEADGITQIQTRLRNGDLVDTLEEMETDCDVVLVGKRGEAADFAKLHLGSNVERVTRASHKPVLVCSRAFRPISRFMIAFDGGSSALKAVEHVARSKVFAGLDCHLLSVGETTPEVRRTLEGAGALLREAGYNVETQVLPGEPEEVIAEQTEQGGIDLLIMGAYRHARIRSMIIGSTTSEVIRSCLVPLLLFR